MNKIDILKMSKNTKTKERVSLLIKINRFWILNWRIIILVLLIITSIIFVWWNNTEVADNFVSRFY